jgi:hypothetical protein
MAPAAFVSTMAVAALRSDTIFFSIASTTGITMKLVRFGLRGQDAGEAVG